MKRRPAARSILLAILLIAGLVTGVHATEPVNTHDVANEPNATATDAVLVGLPQPALVAVTLEAEKVCRGRCTYFTSEHSFTTPCSPSCDCEDSVNGHPLHSFSCGMVPVSPIH